MGEGGRRRRVGEVVGRHVDGLDRGDRAALGRGDALLELAHLVGERGLVTHRAGHTAQQRRDLGACLHEAEDVVDEEQHVLAADVAEVLGHGEAGQADAQARAGRLVHLAEDQRRLVDDARLLHLDPEVVTLAGALADAAEDGQAAVLGGDVVDELLHDDGLADAGAAEQADLAALHVGREQVDDLDARLEELVGRDRAPRSRAPGGGSASAPRRSDVAEVVDGSPVTLIRRPSVPSPTGTRDRPRRCRSTSTPRASPSVESMATARTLSSPRCCCTSATTFAVWPSPLSMRDRERVVDGRQLVRKADVDDRADHLDHSSFVHLVSTPCCAVMPPPSTLLVRPRSTRARSAPATTSRISCVMLAWRARFMASVSDADHLLGAVAGVAHGRHARALLAGARLEQGAVDRDLDVGGQQPLEDLRRVGLVDEASQVRACVPVLARHFLPRDRQDLHVHAAAARTGDVKWL